MNAPVTRRALLGATAAVGAVGLPTAASAVADAGDPDAALLDLITRWPAARAAYTALADRSQPLWDLYDDLEPSRPAGLHWHPSDLLDYGHETGILPDGTLRRYYGFAAVGRLSDSRRSPPAGREARCAEVLETHRAWMADCMAVRDRIGLTEVERAEDEAHAELRGIEEAIVETVPATWAGLAAKALWATGDDKARAFRERWTAGIAADVLAMAERGGAVS